MAAQWREDLLVVSPAPLAYLLSAVQSGSAGLEGGSCADNSATRDKTCRCGFFPVSYFIAFSVPPRGGYHVPRVSVHFKASLPPSASFSYCVQDGSFIYYSLSNKHFPTPDFFPFLRNFVFSYDRCGCGKDVSSVGHFRRCTLLNVLFLVYLRKLPC